MGMMNGGKGRIDPSTPWDRAHPDPALTLPQALPELSFAVLLGMLCSFSPSSPSTQQGWRKGS